MKYEKQSKEFLFYHSITIRVLFWIILGMFIMGGIFIIEYYDIYQRLLNTKNDQYLASFKKKVIQEKKLAASEILKQIAGSIESFQYIDVFEKIDQMVNNDKTLINALLIDLNGYVHYQTKTDQHVQSVSDKSKDLFFLPESIQLKLYTKDDKTWLECLVPITIQLEKWGLLSLHFNLGTIEREKNRMKKQEHFLIFSSVIWIFGVWISGVFSLAIILFLILSRHSKRLIQMGKKINNVEDENVNLYKTLANRSDETGFLAYHIQHALNNLINKFDHSKTRYDHLNESYENYSQLNEKKQLLLQEIRTGLKEWEQYYRSTINICQEALIFLSKDAEILEVNQAFLNMTAYHMADIQGIEMLNLVPKEWKNIYSQQLMRQIYNHLEPSPIEMVIRKKDQTFLYLSVSGRLCKKENNEFHKIILSGINISSNKRMQFLFNDLELLLQNDLKDAIGRIVGLSELMTAKTEVGKKDLIEWSGIIHQNARKMLDEIQQFFNFFKIEAGDYVLNYRMCHLSQMFQKIETDYSSLLLSKSIHIQYTMNDQSMNWDQDIEIWGDCNLLYVMFSRLLEDLFHLCNKNQCISISCFQKKDFHVTISCDKSISELDYHAFFSRSFDNSTYRKGAYIAMLIAKVHGGTIGLRSTKTSQGTQIILILPGKHSVEWIECRKTPLHILIVDDTPNNQILINHYLSENTKWTNHIANNGKEAVDLFSSNEYDMIVMDIEMPVMDGFSAIKSIREIEQARGDQNKHVYIVALSADSSDNTRKKSIDAGADAFLKKPVEQQNLTEIIKKAQIFH